MLLIINKGEAFDCTARNYKTAFALLIVTHIFSFVPFAVTAYRFNTSEMRLNLEKTLEFISLVLYMLTILYVQDLVKFDIGIAECEKINASGADFCTENFCDLNSLGSFTPMLKFEVFMFYA